jgi:hypothetical protein
VEWRCSQAVIAFPAVSDRVVGVKWCGGFSLPVWDGYGRNYCKEPEWKSSLREKLYDPDATWKDIHVVPWSYDEHSGVAHSNHITPDKFFDSNAKSAIQDCDLQGLSGMALINKLIESACSRNVDR